MKHKNIRALREDHDLTQVQAAKILGISQRSYSDYETGRAAFKANHLIALANFYGVSIDYLLGRTKNPKINL